MYTDIQLIQDKIHIYSLRSCPVRLRNPASDAKAQAQVEDAGLKHLLEELLGLGFRV